jgi:Fic-DOC domain mobile mystery protein B
VLDERYLRQLHRGMFRDVWKWAGALRKTPRNIGVEPWKIAEDLQRLIGDTQYWIEQKIFAPDEIAARFHHRLVWIHPFPNGNGRHARLATDLLLVALGRPRFSWGLTSLADANETRALYVAALRAADAHDIGLLLEFVHS